MKDFQTNSDLHAIILDGIKKQGGWVNAHCHLDKSYSITTDKLEKTYASLQEKWDMIDEYKKTATVSDIYDHMAYGVEQQIKQGVTVLCSFIDVDPLMKDKAMKAADKVRQNYKGDIKLLFANQTIKGVLDKEAREWFDRASEFVDIIGGLPGKDKSREDEHIDVLLSTGKKLGKRVHVHVDQLNTPKEIETEILTKKTIEHGMEGRVSAIHGISIATHPKSYRIDLYQQMKKAGVSMIACPSAWIDHQRTEELMPFHNAVTPVDELVPVGITVAIGPDDIADYYKPFSDGNMMTELRFLLESCHFYNIDELVNIATTNGRKVLGIGK